MNTIALNPLTISDIIIRQDADGRYCLNGLHKAAGNEKRHSPNYFLDVQQTKDLITEIESTTVISVVEQKQAVKVINGGNKQGTYGVKDMVYAYAMWISPAFTLKVIRAYDALVTAPQYGLKSLPPSPYISEPQAAQFKKSMEAHCKSNGAKYPVLYRKVYKYFGITTYTHIPAGKLEEAAQLCGMKLLPLSKPRLPKGQQALTFTQTELDALIAERINTLPSQNHNPDLINILTRRVKELKSKAVEGEVMPRLGSDQIITTKAALREAFEKSYPDVMVVKLGQELRLRMSELCPDYIDSFLSCID